MDPGASVVEELDVDLDAVLGGRGASHGADARRSTTAAADHTAEIARTDAHGKARTATVISDRHAHRLGLIDDRTNEVLEHCDGGGSRHDAHPALEALNCSMAPEISRSFATRSVGWAPSDSHLTALSLSTVRTDGSWRGS